MQDSIGLFSPKKKDSIGLGDKAEKDVIDNNLPYANKKKYSSLANAI